MNTRVCYVSISMEKENIPRKQIDQYLESDLNFEDFLLKSIEIIKNLNLSKHALKSVFFIFGSVVCVFKTFLF